MLQLDYDHKNEADKSTKNKKKNKKTLMGQLVSEFYCSI